MMDKNTEIIYCNSETGMYRKGTVKDRGPSEVPACTFDHFIHETCKMFEEIFPNIGANPMWEDVEKLADEFKKAFPNDNSKNMEL